MAIIKMTIIRIEVEEVVVVEEVEELSEIEVLEVPGEVQQEV